MPIEDTDSDDFIVGRRVSHNVDVCGFLDVVDPKRVSCAGAAAVRIEIFAVLDEEEIGDTHYLSGNCGRFNR